MARRSFSLYRNRELHGSDSYRVIRPGNITYDISRETANRLCEMAAENHVETHCSVFRGFTAFHFYFPEKEEKVEMPEPFKKGTRIYIETELEAVTVLDYVPTKSSALSKANDQWDYFVENENGEKSWISFDIICEEIPEQ